MESSIPASKEVGSLLAVFRKLFNLRQENLAKLLGIGRRSVLSNIEIGQADIPYGVLYRFLKVIDYVIEKSDSLNLNVVQLESIRIMRIQIKPIMEFSESDIIYNIDNGNMVSVNTHK